MGKKPNHGDVTLGRRELLFGALVLALPAGCSSEPAIAEEPSPFRHGVASGDPLPDAVILWTRVTSEGSGDVAVTYTVAEDPELTRVVAEGSATATAARDFTVKVDAKGLAAGRTYYYRFSALGRTSATARTRTAPASDSATARVRFAVVSCSSYGHGYFHVYRHLAKEADLDAVVHLGDYVYEYASSDYGDVRAYEPETECLTLADYRKRHALYKRDADLAAVHRQHPFIVIWDDHEIANDGYKTGAQNHTAATEGDFATRKAAAMQAYMEWMPIREQTSGDIYRKLAFGDLVDLVLLDTRYHGRTVQPGGTVGSAIGAPPAPDPARTLLGDDQATWMEAELLASKAKWRLLGQQVMVGNLILDPGKSLANLDQWHGYPESRKRLLSFVEEKKITNVVVLTGDIHSSWANEITQDPLDPAVYDPEKGKPAVMVEFVTPGVTSPGIPQLFLSILDDARPKNPHVRYVDGSKRGFVLLDVTQERVQAAWHHMIDVVDTTAAAPTFSVAWSVRAGQTRLYSEAEPAKPREGAAPVIA